MSFSYTASETFAFHSFNFSSASFKNGYETPLSHLNLQSPSQPEKAFRTRNPFIRQLSKWNEPHDEPTILAGVSSCKGLGPSIQKGKDRSDTTFGECFGGSPDIIRAVALLTLKASHSFMTLVYVDKVRHSHQSHSTHTEHATTWPELV